MKSILIAAFVGLITSIFLTPLVVKYFRNRGIGQEIRQDGPHTHLVKRGTPTMGGLVIIGSTCLGYAIAHLVTSFVHSSGPTASGILLLLLMLGCGLVGFVDDYLKLWHGRNLGLRGRTKFLGQLFVALAFGVGAMMFKNPAGLTPGSRHLSYLRDIHVISLGIPGFLILIYIMVAASTNSVNLTDGMDGLVAGSAAMVMGAYVLVTFLQSRTACAQQLVRTAGCYHVRDPQDLALVAAAALGACFGFLWWNAKPAQIFMGDTGAMALGGLLTGLAVFSRTELLLVILGGLYAVVTLSVVMQIGWFKITRIRTGTGQRIFRMSPLHNHFELGGWDEAKVVVRFWIISGLSVSLGVALFYAGFISGS